MNTTTIKSIVMALHGNGAKATHPHHVWQREVKQPVGERNADIHAAPTWENQLWHARRLAADKGLEALNSPHAMTGRICGCGSCFCCAALFVYDELLAVKPKAEGKS